MKTLLRIDASIRHGGSHSRAMADHFEEKWKEANPEGKIIYRDLSKEQTPHLLNSTAEAFYLPKEQLSPAQHKAIGFSNDLIAELKTVDALLISSPLYNFNIASQLKSYIDHICRAGHTFKVNDDGSYQGLLNIPSVYLITSKGGTYRDTAMEALDFQEAYLKAICAFLALDIKKIFSLEGTAQTEVLEKNKAKLYREIEETLKSTR